jgi:large repetitive protein
VSATVTANVRLVAHHRDVRDTWVGVHRRSLEVSMIRSLTCLLSWSITAVGLLCGGEALTLSASAASVAVGSQVTVTVALANTAPYAVWGSSVRFDASKLRLDSVVAGTQETYVADSRSLADIRASGDVRCGGYCLDGSGRATDAGGNASIARLTFTVTAVGSSQLTSPGWSGSLPFGDTLITRSGTSRTPSSPSALTITGTSTTPPPDTPPPVTPAAPTLSGPSTAPVISGTSEAGATITIRSDGAVIGTTTANGAGAWSFPITGLTPGAHQLTVTATDAAGNTSGMSSATTVTIPSSPDSGTPNTAESSSKKRCGLGSGLAAFASALAFTILTLRSRRTTSEDHGTIPPAA